MPSLDLKQVFREGLRAMHSFDFQQEISSPYRNLLVIDDLKIRKELFSATAMLIKKIKKLEESHRDFLLIDQQLYENWHHFTFRHERQECERLERRYQNLSIFKMHLVYTAETSNISLAEAYKILQDEEYQYQQGDDDWRFIIDKLRQHRLEYAKARLQKKTEQEQPHQGSPILSKLQEDEPPLFPRSADVSSEPGQSEPGQTEAQTSDVSRLNRKSRSLYHYCQEISDETMKRSLADSKTGYDLFKEIFQIIMTCGDWALLGRLWSNSPEPHKSRILKRMPHHLRSFLDQLMLESKTEQSPAPADMSEEIELKAKFRKLARRLHPDKQNDFKSIEVQEWARKILQQAQSAYEAQDLKRLHHLDLISTVQLGNLKDLTLDEIYESSLAFAEEFETLKRNLKSFEKHPAWRFSSRRSYSGLAEKIRKDFESKLEPLKSNVEELEAWLANLTQNQNLKDFHWTQST